MQFKVPQNIDMQDRILGPLTMIQFIYAVVGGGLCYAFFNSVPKPFSYVLIIPIASFTLAMIFLKINERPFLDFLLSFSGYLASPKSRVWHHDSYSDFDVEVYTAKKTQQNVVQTKQYTHDQITELANRLDKTNLSK